MSTCEAEYTAIAAAGREAVWITNIQFHARTKHIDVQCHWIREAIANGRIKLQYLHTSEMKADVLMKALGRIKFDQMVDLVGMKP
jgi:hypothetical protein